MRYFWLVVAALMVVSSAMGTSRQSYKDVGATDGLVITAFKTSQCTGTPPTVTPNGGAMQYVFSGLGSGLYQCESIPEGHYYLFQGAGFGTYNGVYYQPSDSALAQLTAITADGWVTTVRLATGAVTTVKIADGAVDSDKLAANAVTSAKVATSTITNSKMATGAVTRDKCATTFVGTDFDDTFQLDEVQKWLRAGQGSWDSTSGFDLGQLDSLMKKLVLNLAYTSPGIALSLSIGNQLFGLDAVWDQSGGSAAHNDSATAEYQIWVGTSAPPITLPGELDASEQATLATTMSHYATIQRPSYNGMRRFINFTGTIYIVIVGVDWQGTQYGSAAVSGTSTNGDIGSVTLLQGGYLYDDQPVLSYLKDIANKLQNVETKSEGAAARSPIVIYHKRDQAVSGINKTTTMPIDTITSNGPPVTTGQFCYRKFADYSTAEVVVEARMRSSGETGSIFIEVPGGGTTMTLPIVYSAGFVLYSSSVSIASQVADSLYGGFVRGIANSGGDTLIIRNISVSLR